MRPLAAPFTAERVYGGHVGSIEAHKVGCVLPTGNTLFSDVSFKVGDGEHVALVGANGAGKTTLFRQIAAGGQPTEGSINVGGSLAFMDQMVGMQEGAIDYITKPFEVDDLLARIEQILRQQPVRDVPS